MKINELGFLTLGLGFRADVEVSENQKPIVRPGRKKSPTSEATLKPWEAEGISRNTWYVNKRIQREREDAALKI